MEGKPPKTTQPTQPNTYDRFSQNLPQVPKFLPTGLYTAKLNWSGKPNAFINSAKFQISGSDIAVETPTGEERLVAGMIIDSKFYATGYVTSVLVQLQRMPEEDEEEGGEDELYFVGYFDSNVGRSSEISVEIPRNVPTGTFTIRFGAADDDDSFLTVHSKPFYVSSNPGMVITGPKSGNSFTSGEDMTLEWITKGVPINGGSVMRISLLAECAEQFSQYVRAKERASAKEGLGSRSRSGSRGGVEGAVYGVGGWRGQSERQESACVCG
jgi:hypothetical protein